MFMAKKGTTRYYSSKQERAIAKLLDGQCTSNSGASRFNAGDVLAGDFLIECKTCIQPKQSFSIRKEWLEKNEHERMDMQKPYSALAFSFGEDEPNYFIVNEKTFKLLYETLQNNKE
jgi:hypothetical protein